MQLSIIKNKQELDLIETNWSQQVDECSFSDENRQFVEFECAQLFNQIRETQGWGELGERVNEYLFQKVSDNDEMVCAIVALVQSKKGSSTMIKLKDIYFSPEIDATAQDKHMLEKRIAVFQTTVVGVLRSSEYRETVKFYAREDDLYTFLKGVHDVFSTITTFEGFKTSIEGRWLTFKP